MSDLPPHTKLLGVKWVLKIKKIDGKCEMHKTRLVVKVYIQEAGFHCTSSFFTCRVSVRIYLKTLALLSTHNTNQLSSVPSELVNN